MIEKIEPTKEPVCYSVMNNLVKTNNVNRKQILRQSILYGVSYGMQEKRYNVFG